LKAMALEPRNRYSSALALGEDIQRWLADQPVTAYSEPLPARVARWARGHRRAAALALGCGFLVVLILLSLINYLLDLGRLVKVPNPLLRNFWLPIIFVFWFGGWWVWKSFSQLLPRPLGKIAGHWTVAALLVPFLALVLLVWVVAILFS
jgi:hypothetical protein